MTTATPDSVRQKQLAEEIEMLVNQKSSLRHPFRRYRWKVESQSEYRAVMVQDRRCHHVLHLLLSVLTLGVWVIVWVLDAAAAQRPKRKVLVV